MGMRRPRFSPIYTVGIYNAYPKENKNIVNYYNEEGSSIILEETSKGACTYLRNTTIKQKISTLFDSSPLSTVFPEHVLVSHPGHCFIINVQPNFRCVATPVRGKNIHRIVPAACRFAVMVKHSMELVMWRV